MINSDVRSYVYTPWQNASRRSVESDTVLLHREGAGYRKLEIATRTIRVEANKSDTELFAMAEERRQHPRIAVQTVFSYICLDEDGTPVDEGMGTTVDISKGGIMIETSRPIETETLLLVSVDKNKKMLEIKGKVVYTRELNASKYLSGIEFQGSAEEVMKMVKNIIIEFHSRKNPIR